MKKVWRLGILLFILACVPFLPILRAGFLNWDDDFYLTENPDIVSPEGWRNTLWRFTTDANVYPAVFASFRLEHALWGFNPVGYHAVNVLLHGLVTVSAFLLLLRLSASTWMAWWTCLLFAVHPMQVTTVAWVSERKSLLGTFFLLLAWVCYLAPREDATDASAFRRKIIFSLSLPFALLAYLSKSSLVVLPVLLLITDRIRRQRWGILLCVHFALAGFMGWILSLREAGPAFEMMDRISLASRAFWYYMLKWIIPIPSAGSLPKWDPTFLNPFNLIAFVGLVLLITVLVRSRSFWKENEWTGVVIFIITLTPSLGFLSFGYQQHAYVSDHFAYLSLFGLSLVLVSLLHRVSFFNNRYLSVLLTVLAFSWGILSWNECGVWKSSESFWETRVERNPSSWVAHQNLATELDRQDRIGEAYLHYERATEIEPENPVGWINLGRSLIRSGSEGEAVVVLNHSIELNPNYREAYGFLAEALSRLGRMEEAMEARKKAKD